MRNFIILFLIMSFFFTYLNTKAYADSDSSTSQEPDNNPGMGVRRRGSGKKLNLGKATKNPGTIRGLCTVIESTANPFSGPCVSSLLILTDKDGNEMSKSRTTAKGDFEFIADPNMTYHLVSGSRYYQVVGPMELIHGGENINLKLQQKE